MNKCFRALLLLALVTATCSACTGRLIPHGEAPAPVRNRYAVIVTAAAGDTLASLAKTWLKDPRRAWQIAAYNNINTVKPGWKVVIPLRPVEPGGLQIRGYQTIPVLLYDRLESTPSRKGVLSANDFEQHLRHLKSKGFMTLTLEDFYKFTTLRSWLPPLSVLICLDSNERWVYDIAYPLLKQYDMQAAVFVAVDSIGTKGRMTWDQLAEMAHAGFSVGSRGLTGRDLTRARTGEPVEEYLNRIEAEVKDSRRTMEAKLGRPCPDFAYPNGAFNDFLIALLKKYDYRSGYARVKGSNPFFVDNFKIKRTLVAANWDAAGLQKHLSTFHPLELR